MARKKNFDEGEVLEKALQLFWKKGYNATSIQDLVDELGINRASIYDTWGDKHQLYVAALQRYRQNSSSWLLNQIRSDKPASEIIEAFLNHVIEDVMQDHDKKGCFVVNSTTELANLDPDIQMLVSENKQTIERVLAELVKEGQESGEFNTKQSAQAYARFIFNNINGLRVVCKTFASREELQEVVDITIRSLK
ncbi:TetR/AcrR family transcriptional regulator [Roseivirga sp.]|uniref:TetR/AcrR family transcriptional regulator n=1 Tax=Roseivirga sp. TaxID=1964215 RepID=UPI003B52E4ED